MRPLFTILLTLAVASPAAAQHPSIRAGEWLRVDFRARLQGDIRASQAPSAENADKEDDRLDVARRRVGIEGRVAHAIPLDRLRQVMRDYRRLTE